MKLILLSILVLFACVVGAQSSGQFKIGAIITDENNAPIPDATVNLCLAKDSSLVKAAITERDGKVLFEDLKPAAYFLLVTHTSYQKLYSNPVTIGENKGTGNLGTIVLTRTAKQLQEVTVQTQKPFIERQIDRIVVNVDNSIVSAGSNAMEILERSPGVVIDRNDNISLKGKQGVIVMINGKPSGIAGSDLANYLRSLPSNTISKIEIITNPSAKYDAEGNAGIINIVLKKDQHMGTNGTLTTNYGQGFYPTAGGGLTFNHRNKNVNLFGSYNYSYRDNYADLVLYRQFLENGSVVGIYDQANFINFVFKTHVYRAGLDYTLSKKTVVGVVLNGLANRFSSGGNTHTNVLDGRAQKQSYNDNFSSTLDTLHNYSGNINLKHTIDSAGRELTMDIDYAHYQNTDGQKFVTDFYDLNGSTTSPENIIRGDVNGKLDIKSIKVDYTHPLKSGAKLEAGAKSSVVTNDNDLKYFDASSGSAIYDPSQSNHFIYKENINAAYVNFSKEYKKISVQAGLRLEQTVANGNQVTTNVRFDTNYINLFPSAYFNYTLSEKHSFGLSVSRRLDRPSYRQLNPFRFYVNNSTYSEGNPYLQPQYTYAFELSHTYLQKITTTLSYSITKNNIINVLIPSTTQDKITIQTDKNLASLDYFGLSISAPVTIAKWWSSINNLTAYDAIYKGDLANTTINSGRVTFNINTNNTFTIGKNGLSAEINGVYQYRELYAYMDVRSYGYLSAGVQKLIMQKKGTLKLSLADIFHGSGNEATNSYRDYIEHFIVSHDTRVATLSFTWRFGNTKVAAARRMSGGAEEEKQRAR